MGNKGTITKQDKLFFTEIIAILYKRELKCECELIEQQQMLENEGDK